MDKQQNSLRSFYCIDYPALVKNEKEAIRTLGGEARIQQTLHSKKHTKLLLNFTPDNIFAKVLCSNQYDDPTSEHDEATVNESADISSEIKSKNEFPKETTQLNHKHNDLISMPCLLMSVKRSKDASSSTDVKCEIIGKIKSMHTFRKIADFQYLPMNSVSKQSDGKQSEPPSSTSFTFNAFYDSFLFNNIHNYDNELRKNTIPKLFILPPFFSRFDDPVSYSFKSETVKKVDSTSDNQAVMFKKSSGKLKDSESRLV